MNATSYTIIQVPLSEAAIEYAERYCMFYDNAEFFTTPETVTITHRTTIDPHRHNLLAGKSNWGLTKVPRYAIIKKINQVR